MVAPLVELLRPVCNLQVRSNWQTFVRPGSFTPVGIIVHHTAGQNDLNVVINGRSDLPGPLSNLYSDRDDPYKITLISGGRCNHAGAGSQKVLNETRMDIAPTGDAAARGLIDGPGGNGYFYGIECENLGTGAQPWPSSQLVAVARCCAAICKHHGWSANRVIGHREWTRRKPDPKGFSMGDFRGMVAKYLSGSTPTPAQEAQMAAIANVRGFCIMHNNDLVITDRDGAIYHFDADGVADSTDYKGAYNARPELWNGSTPTAVRECVGVYATNAGGSAVPDGDPNAVGYCQVFNDSARYTWK